MSNLQAGDYYIENGKWVFTAQYLLRRGYCCKSGCRHCPYGDNNCVEDTTISQVTTNKGDQKMAVSTADLQELRRIATNTYDADKAFMNRVIKGIGAMESELQRLRNEIVTLNARLAAK